MNSYKKTRAGFTRSVDRSEASSMRGKAASQRLTAGFTVIELLVVIAIIGILATIVISMLGGAQSKAKDKKALAQLSSMRTQAELYRSVYGSYGPVTSNCDEPGTLFGPGAPESLNALMEGMPSGYVEHCSVRSDSWAVLVALSDDEVWCADSYFDELVTGDECWIE